jgi:tRNA(Ile)-lysidine synthase
MINKVRAIIDKYQMVNPGERIVVAVSGGPDSIALLQILSMLSNEYGIELIAAHINHGLRGVNSDEEERFTGLFSASLGIPFESKSADIKALSRERGNSVEETGREERYKFLTRVAQRYDAQKIAVGHHLHDHVETVLMNVMRGCGIEGLRGILPVRDGIIIRPLISSTRDEILSFLDIQGISYRNDGSNFDNVCLRNKIRNRLIPLLKVQYNPNIETSLAHLSEIAGQEDAYLQEVVDRALSRIEVDDVQGKKITLTIAPFLQLHEAIQRRIIKVLLERLAVPGKAIGYVHIKSILNLMRHASSGARMSLPGSIAIRREYGELVLVGNRSVDGVKARRSESGGLHYGETGGADFSYEVMIPGRLDIVELGTVITFGFVEKIPFRRYSEKPTVIYLDYDKLSLPLCIRNRRPGDRIQPLGMEGSKKIKSYLIDKKMPRHLRMKIPLLVDRESVLWIVGMAMSERIKITDKTLTVVKVEII